MEKIIITSHAKKRLRQRFGLPCKAHARHAIKAFMEGIFAKDHPHKPTAIYFRVQQERDETKALIIYNDGLYVYGYDYDKATPTLITVYQLNRVII